MMKLINELSRDVVAGYGIECGNSRANLRIAPVD